MSQDQEKGKLLGNKRKGSAKKEEKQKEKIFIINKQPHSNQVQNNKSTTVIYNALEEQMKTAIENWDGKNISVLPFIGKPGTIKYQIETEIRPMLQDWVELRRQQKELEGELDSKVASRSNWEQLSKDEKEKTIIRNRLADKDWKELNTRLCKKQKQIAETVAGKTEKSPNSGGITKPINQNLITPIYDKYGGKAYSITSWKQDKLTIDCKNIFYHYQKKNKPNISIYTKPDVIKKIQKEHNVKGLEGLIDYLNKQPKNTNTYKDKEIKEIILYVKMLILSRVSTQKKQV